MKYVFHGSKIVGVARGVTTDCSRRPTAGDADDNSFAKRFRAACDEICVLLARRPSAAVNDRRKQEDGIRRINQRNAEFWKGRVS